MVAARFQSFYQFLVERLGSLHFIKLASIRWDLLPTSFKSSVVAKAHAAIYLSKHKSQKAIFGFVIKINSMLVGQDLIVRNNLIRLYPVVRSL
jgi:hypothetical protein